MARVLDVLATEKASNDVDALPRAKYAQAKKAAEDTNSSAYADVIYTDAAALAEIAWDDSAELLGADLGFDVAPGWAAKALRTHADEVGGTIADNDRRTMLDVLGNALANGWSAKDTGTALKSALAPMTSYDDDGKPVRTLDSDSYFDMVARTELQRASNVGQFALYEKAGVQNVTWVAAEPCDLCAEADGVTLPLGETFPGVDVECPPSHPRCRCILSPSDEDLESVDYDDDDRAQARRGGYASDEEAQAQRDKLQALADKQAERAARRKAKE